MRPKESEGEKGHRTKLRGRVGSRPLRKVAPLNAKAKITHSSWPMRITFHLGEDEVSRFEIASHVSGARPGV